MNRINVTLTCGSFPSLTPLVRGEIVSPDVDIDIRMAQSGSVRDWLAATARTLNDTTIHGGETSFSKHLRRIEQGDRSLVAVPVFIMREFQGRHLYVRKGSHIRSGADLNGARIGMYAFQATGTLWYRHFLEHIGIDLGTVTWVTGGVDEPGPADPVKYKETAPPNVEVAPADRSLSEMLISGEIDALFAEPKSRHFHRVNGPIVRLFDNIKEVEQQYYRATGVRPLQHMLVLRSEVWKSNPWIAQTITEIFKAGDKASIENQLLYGGGSPWSYLDAEEWHDLKGEGNDTHGIEGNEAALEIAYHYAQVAGVTRRKMTTEEVFAEYLSSKSK